MSAHPSKPGLPSEGERIAKMLARAGICSRRDAERAIAAGRVEVDGKQLTTPAFKVTERNRVTFDGKPVASAEETRLWLYHKPTGLVTTHKDPKGRPTVFDSLPKRLPRVISVGRLDINSEGLLLLTNDGAFARALELPSTGWLRCYRVRVRGHIDPDRLAQLEGGVTVDGMRYGPINARLERQLRTNAWLTVALREGKNREVRRVHEHLGLDDGRLIRVSYGPFTLGGLEPGGVEQVAKQTLFDRAGTFFDTGRAPPPRDTPAGHKKRPTLRANRRR